MLNATEKVISTYVEAIRPPEEIRDKLDLLVKEYGYPTDDLEAIDLDWI